MKVLYIGVGCHCTIYVPEKLKYIFDVTFFLCHFGYSLVLRLRLNYVICIVLYGIVRNWTSKLYITEGISTSGNIIIITILNFSNSK